MTCDVTVILYLVLFRDTFHAPCIISDPSGAHRTTPNYYSNGIVAGYWSVKCMLPPVIANPGRSNPARLDVGLDTRYSDINHKI